MSDNLKIIQADDHNHTAFKNLQQFYEFEFSPITRETTDQFGQYDCSQIKDKYWSKNGADIYLLYEQKTPIGFAVVNLSSMISDDNNVRDIADFFIMPAYRHNGTGTWFSHEVFSKYKGNWEVRQLESLTKAHKFWRESIQKFTLNNFKEKIYFDKEWGEHLHVQIFYCT